MTVVYMNPHYLEWKNKGDEKCRRGRTIEDMFE